MQVTYGAPTKTGIVSRPSSSGRHRHRRAQTTSTRGKAAGGGERGASVRVSCRAACTSAAAARGGCLAGGAALRRRRWRARAWIRRGVLERDASATTVETDYAPRAKVEGFVGHPVLEQQLERSAHDVSLQKGRLRAGRVEAGREAGHRALGVASQKARVADGEALGRGERGVGSGVAATKGRRRHGDA